VCARAHLLVSRKDQTTLADLDLINQTDAQRATLLPLEYKRDTSKHDRLLQTISS
jgi:hypothetical protein